MDVKKYLLDKHADLEPLNEGFSFGIEKLVDYVLMVYIRDEENPEITLNQKKESAMIKLKISKDKDRELLMLSKSDITHKLVTSLLHKTANREFELYISALEASTILLDVVRRPIDDRLDDEKWLSALRAKKQGFQDAEELLNSANKIAERMLGTKEADIQEHVKEVVFGEGMTEKLAKKAAKKK